MIRLSDDEMIILSTYLLNLVFCDQFPILGGDLLLQADDLLLQGVDLPHVVHVGPIVSFWRLNFGVNSPVFAQFRHHRQNNFVCCIAA